MNHIDSVFEWGGELVDFTSTSSCNGPTSVVQSRLRPELVLMMLDDRKVDEPALRSAGHQDLKSLDCKKLQNRCRYRKNMQSPNRSIQNLLTVRQES